MPHGLSRQARCEESLSVRNLVLLGGVAIFAAVALAVTFHFKSDQQPAKFTLLSVLSAANIFIFGRELWLHPKHPAYLASAVCLFIVAAALFIASIQASRSAQLKLIFDPRKPSFILRTGPYRYIRHPFYSSYILYWLGCAVATLHPINIAYIVLLVPILVVASRDEEKGFERTALAADYADYRRSAGLLWPRLWNSRAPVAH